VSIEQKYPVSFPIWGKLGEVSSGAQSSRFIFCGDNILSTEELLSHHAIGLMRSVLVLHHLPPLIVPIVFRFFEDIHTRHCSANPATDIFAVEIHGLRVEHLLSDENLFDTLVEVTGAVSELMLCGVRYLNSILIED
jgi:hypothetical protein